MVALLSAGGDAGLLHHLLVRRDERNSASTFSLSPFALPKPTPPPPLLVAGHPAAHSSRVDDLRERAASARPSLLMHQQPPTQHSFSFHAAHPLQPPVHPPASAPLPVAASSPSEYSASPASSHLSMPAMSFSSLVSPSANLSFLSSPSQHFTGYSPPSFNGSLSTGSPPQPHSQSFAPSFSPAFSPPMGGSVFMADSKSLSRYRVLEGPAMGGGGGAGMGGKVSDEHLKILTTLSQLSQTNGFSPPQQQQMSGFNPMPLPPPTQHQQQHQHQQQQQQHQAHMQHAQMLHQQHMQQQQQIVSPPQPLPQLGLQQPVPVAPLAQSSLLNNITPPMSSSSLLNKMSTSTPSQSPSMEQQSGSPQSLLMQLQLLVHQQLQQRAQTLQAQSATTSPSAMASQLQQLHQLQQFANHVLQTSSPQQLQRIAAMTQHSPSSLPMTLLQIAQQDERVSIEARGGGGGGVGGGVMMTQGQAQPVQPLQAGAGPSSYFVGGHGVGGEVDPMYVSIGEEVGSDGARPKGKFLSGSSCHQCKTRRISAELVYCAQSHAKKGRTRKRRIEDQPSVYILPHPASTSYKAERLCRKKYCARCLSKFYGEEPPAKIGPHGDRTWSCPGCRGLCTCAACKRQQSKRENKKKNALAQQQAQAKAATLAAQSGKEGQPPVFSSTHDSKGDSGGGVKQADGEAVRGPASSSSSSAERVKEERSDGRSDEAGGGSSLAVAVNHGASASSPPASAVVSPATTQSTMSTTGTSSLGSTSAASSQSETPPTPLHHLAPLSSVVTPAPVYSSLSGGVFSHSPGMTMSSLGSLSSSPLLPMSMGLHGLQYGSSFLSPQTPYTSLTSLPLFPSSAFSSSPPTSPYPTAGHQLLLPHLSTPHMAGVGLQQPQSSPPGMDTSSSHLMALTGASPITWTRGLRGPGVQSVVAPTAASEQSTAAAAQPQ